MPQIQFDQLKPGAESSSTLMIQNASGNTAHTAIEVVRLSETKQSLASYVEVIIQEIGDEPRNVFGPKSLAELYQNGYTILSTAAPNQTKEYETRFTVSNNIPDEFQKQKITFDIKIGTEYVVATPKPSPHIILERVDTATPSAAVLGITMTQQPQQLPPPLPQQATSPIVLSIATAVVTTILILMFQHLLRKRRRSPG